MATKGPLVPSMIFKSRTTKASSKVIEQKPCRRSSESSMSLMRTSVISMALLPWVPESSSSQRHRLHHSSHASAAEAAGHAAGLAATVANAKAARTAAAHLVGHAAGPLQFLSQSANPRCKFRSRLLQTVDQRRPHLVPVAVVQSCLQIIRRRRVFRGVAAVVNLRRCQPDWRINDHQVQSNRPARLDFFPATSAYSAPLSQEEW